MARYPSRIFSKALPEHVKKLIDCVDDYWEKKQWVTALTLSRTALKELEDASESDSLDIGLLLSLIGDINSHLEKYDDAETLWKRAILIVEKYDEASMFAAKIYRGLGRLYIELERDEEAEISGRKALEILEDLDDIDAILIADLKDIIGSVCLMLGKSAEGKQLLQAAVSVYAEEFGIGSVEVTNICRLLQVFYLYENNGKALFEAIENSNEITDVIPICSFGTCRLEDFPRSAFICYIRAVKIYESKGFLDESQISEIYMTLGECYLKLCQYFGVKLYFSKSGDFYEKPLKNDVPMIVDATLQSALHCVRSARLKKAEKNPGKFFDNVHTDGSGVSVMKRAKDNENSGDSGGIPILKAKCNVVVSTLKNMCAAARRRW